MTVEINERLRKSCPKPDPRKAKGANELLVKTESARDCEEKRADAILSVIDSANKMAEQLLKGLKK